MLIKKESERADKRKAKKEAKEGKYRAYEESGHGTSLSSSSFQ